MRRQRNRFHMKEQNKTPERELDKTETNNLLDAEFKTLVMRMLMCLVVTHVRWGSGEFHLLPYKDLKKIKEMPTEKACERETKGCLRLCSHGS